MGEAAGDAGSFSMVPCFWVIPSGGPWYSNGGQNNWRDSGGPLRGLVESLDPRVSPAPASLRHSEVSGLGLGWGRQRQEGEKAQCLCIHSSPGCVHLLCLSHNPSPHIWGQQGVNGSQSFYYCGQRTLGSYGLGLGVGTHGGGLGGGPCTLLLLAIPPLQGWGQEAASLGLGRIRPSEHWDLPGAWGHYCSLLSSCLPPARRVHHWFLRTAESCCLWGVKIKNGEDGVVMGSHLSLVELFDSLNCGYTEF